VSATDIHAYGYGNKIDFLNPVTDYTSDWIITNPPYVKAEQFVARARQLARVGFAMFTRTQFLESIGRYERIFRDTPPTLIAFFTERVPLHKGRWEPDGTTATAYCWLVWVKGREPMPPFWIPPGQRRLLSKPDDRQRFAAWSLPPDYVPDSAGKIVEAAE
jgi:hypothetical protein